MDSDSVTPGTATSLTTIRPELLANIRVDPTVTAPLGGLNPYNQHYSIIGKQFHRLLIEYAGLTKNQCILDIGCGTGRLAAQLTDFSKEYHGFDVHPHFIDYCNTTYKSPSVHFDCFDINHAEYNPTGKINPLEFEFPYPALKFDIVVAIAVFNHFKVEWVGHYIKQVKRILKPRGVFFGTHLLLNEQSIKFSGQRRKPPHQFAHYCDESRCDFENRPLFNIAHRETTIRRMFIDSGFMIREPILYGEWCGSSAAITGPDVVIARLN